MGEALVANHSLLFLLLDQNSVEAVRWSVALQQVLPWSIFFFILDSVCSGLHTILIIMVFSVLLD